MEESKWIKHYRNHISKDMDIYLLDILSSYGLAPKIINLEGNRATIAQLSGQSVMDAIKEKDKILYILDQMINWFIEFDRVMNKELNMSIRLIDFSFNNFLIYESHIWGTSFEFWEKGTKKDNYVRFLAWLWMIQIDLQIIDRYVGKITEITRIEKEEIQRLTQIEVLRINENKSIYHKMKQCDAFIITGGKSSRMGFPKHELKIGSYSFLTLMQYHLSEFPSVRLSVGIRSEIIDPNVEHVCDELDHIGPLGGIYTSLNYSDKEYIYIVPCDMPGIDKCIRDSLFLALDEEADCVIAKIDDRIYPLIGIYKSRILPQITKRVTEKNYKLMTLLDQVKTVYVDIKQSSNRLYMNVNDIESYEKLVKSLSKEQYPYTSFI